MVGIQRSVVWNSTSTNVGSFATLVERDHQSSPLTKRGGSRPPFAGVSRHHKGADILRAQPVCRPFDAGLWSYCGAIILLRLYNVRG